MMAFKDQPSSTNEEAPVEGPARSATASHRDRARAIVGKPKRLLGWFFGPEREALVERVAEALCQAERHAFFRGDKRAWQVSRNFLLGMLFLPATEKRANLTIIEDYVASRRADAEAVARAGRALREKLLKALSESEADHPDDDASDLVDELVERLHRAERQAASATASAASADATTAAILAEAAGQIVVLAGISEWTVLNPMAPSGTAGFRTGWDFHRALSEARDHLQKQGLDLAMVKQLVEGKRMAVTKDTPVAAALLAKMQRDRQDLR